jgi:thiol-disulfide isomerase/thioredoxin
MRTRTIPAALAAVTALLWTAGCGGTAPTPPKTEGGTLPDLELATLDGSKIRLADGSGRAKLVNFWATWCAPCREEIPHFNEIYAEFRDDGLDIIAISMDEEGAEVVRPFVAENGMTYPVVLGSDQVAEAFGGVVGFPTTYLVDREGKVVDRWVGVIPPRILEEKVRALVAG